MLTDYSHLTETTNSKVSREQLRRMVTRYRFAATYCEDRDVLEAGCGVGQGLGILARASKKLVAGDYTDSLVNSARNHYGSRVEIQKFDAQEMPFDDRSFDVIILYEAIYYLPQPERFVTECRRVLRSNGNMLICTANKDWSGFARSPSTYRYFSAPELYELLQSNGFSAELFGDCPVSDGSISGALISSIRKIAVNLNLMPNNLKDREKLKRIFFGKLIDMPAELEERMATYVRPVPISHLKSNDQFKVLFGVGTLHCGQ